MEVSGNQYVDRQALLKRTRINIDYIEDELDGLEDIFGTQTINEEEPIKDHKNIEYSLDPKSVMGAYVLKIVSKLNRELSNMKNISIYNELTYIVIIRF